MNLKKKIVLPLILTFALGLNFAPVKPVNAGDEAATNKTKYSFSGNYVQNIGDDAQIDWTKNVVKVTGTGAPPDRGNNAQKRLMAIRAAKVDAFRQMVEIINGVHVSSETVVRDFVTESDVIKTKIEGLIKGAEIVGEPKYMSDGSVEVEMQLKLFGKTSVASIIKPEEQKDEDPPTKLRPAPVAENYTSLILDCKGLGVLPAMSPAVFDADEGEIYVGNLPIDPDHVINEGIVSYASTMAEAKKLERTGANPLILKATKVRGLFKADVYVTNDDAKKILGAETRGKFLKDFKVIMVI